MKKLTLVFLALTALFAAEPVLNTTQASAATTQPKPLTAEQKAEFWKLYALKVEAASAEKEAPPHLQAMKAAQDFQDKFKLYAVNGYTLNENLEYVKAPPPADPKGAPIPAAQPPAQPEKK